MTNVVGIKDLTEMTGNFKTDERQFKGIKVLRERLPEYDGFSSVVYNPCTFTINLKEVSDNIDDVIYNIVYEVAYDFMQELKQSKEKCITVYVPFNKPNNKLFNMFNGVYVEVLIDDTDPENIVYTPLVHCA